MGTWVMPFLRNVGILANDVVHYSSCPKLNKKAPANFKFACFKLCWWAGRRRVNIVNQHGACRGEICPCRHCRRQCKIFTSGVNFSRNNAIYNMNEVQSTFYPDYISKTVHLQIISSFITKKMPKLLIFPAVTLLLREKKCRKLRSFTV